MNLFSRRLLWVVFIATVACNLVALACTTIALASGAFVEGNPVAVALFQINAYPLAWILVWTGAGIIIFIYTRYYWEEKIVNHLAMRAFWLLLCFVSMDCLHDVALLCFGIVI